MDCVARRGQGRNRATAERCAVCCTFNSTIPLVGRRPSAPLPTHPTAAQRTSTSGMSRPRAATSVATSSGTEPLLKLSTAAVRCPWEMSPWMATAWKERREGREGRC
jgi:hypothetical protein